MEGRREERTFGKTEHEGGKGKQSEINGFGW